MKWDDGIDGVHYEIAASTERQIAVLAGPGTGKTAYGLMRRVARLLQEGVDPQEILLISFTRTAAHDLRSKVADLGVSGAESVRATTLHSYCFGLLRQESVLEITRRIPRPLLEHEEKLMLRDIQDDFGSLRDREKLLRAFESGWARGLSDHPGLASLPNDRKFEARFREWLIHHKAMLIGEIIPIAHNFIKQNPVNNEIGKYKHILVDEYQDINFLEQDLIFRLANSEHTSVCVIGDDDQSIYSFRYANPEGILSYRAKPEVKDFNIGVCGRCPRVVLSVANSLMRQAPNRDKPDLVARQDSDGSLAVVQWNTLSDEIEGIAAAIATDIQRERYRPGDILVLVQRHQIGNALRKRLLDLEIPAHSYFGQEPLYSSEAREGLALLRLAIGDDPVSLRVILGLGDNDGRTAAYTRLQAYAASRATSERSILDELVRGIKLPIRVPALIKGYKAALARIDRLDLENVEQVVDELFPRGVEEVASIRIIAVESLPLVDNVKDFAKELVSRVTQQDVPENPDFVRIMSLHKSKGLTSPSVYLMSALDGIVPTINEKQTEKEIMDAMNEQRRLMYVAVTRASQQLVISYCRYVDLAFARGNGIRVAKTTWIDGRSVAATLASPYLRELGPDAPNPVTGEAWIENYADQYD